MELINKFQWNLLISSLDGWIFGALGVVGWPCPSNVGTLIRYSTHVESSWREILGPRVQIEGGGVDL